MRIRADDTTNMPTPSIMYYSYKLTMHKCMYINKRIIRCIFPFTIIVISAEEGKEDNGFIMMAWIHFSNTVRVYSLKGENSGLIILFNSGYSIGSSNNK